MSGFPLWVTILTTAGVFLAIVLLETWRPLRERVESRWRRTLRNLTAGGISAAFVTLLQIPILIPFSAWIQREGWGLLHQVELARGLEIGLAIVLLDYTLWWWHWINHKVPFFWRFHLVHHLDLDLDASTALRFHFGELSLSVFVRALQIGLIGADPYSVGLWQAILFVSILFHHSNLELPTRLERWLVPLIVTPRMHGIHHSDYRNETNSNWSSLFSVWDVLHGTLLLNVPQHEIRIGVHAWRDPSEVTLGKILVQPFVRQKDDWTRPDGIFADRNHEPDRHRLAP